jgi:hypothetical protein
MFYFIKLKLAISDFFNSAKVFIYILLNRINWLYCRLFVLSIIVAINLYFYDREVQVSSSADWEMIPAGFIFAVISMQLTLALKMLSKVDQTRWKKPSWHENPFNFNQPLQFFHFGGWFLLVGSLGCIPLVLDNVNTGLVVMAGAISFGIGLLTGVQLSYFLYSVSHR